MVTSNPRCPKNEVYYNCTGECIPRKCDELGFPLHCNKKCRPECVCKDNYVRNDRGVCIPIEKCPSCGGDRNAQQGCGNHCGRSCSDIGKPPRPCPLFCIYNGCDCRPGYYYDPNTKKCVKPKDCTRTCPVNEEYSTCINGGCVARNCSQLGKPVICVKIDPKYCIKGCVCIKGYLRDKNGICVPEKQCNTKKCGKHEHWDSCYYKCDGNQTCDDNDKKWNCPKKDKCLKGCRCDKGYCRDKKGNCVPKQEHPKPCGKHEHWDSCYYKCDGNQTCDDNDKKWNCPAKDKCLKGCRCDKGYCRDKKGNCVPKQEHPKKCGKHEHWDSCYYKCDGNQTCDDNDKKWNCPKKDKCLKGCRCDKGYCRDKKGNCVPKQEHPKKCGKHEHWDSCYYKCDGNQTCDDNDKKWNCPKKDKCLKGCRCDKGYCRDKKGNCVPKQEHPKKCGKHEHWDSCYYKCDGNQTCDDNDKKWNCPKKDKCLKGCRCDKGYCRDKKGNCVPKQEHPKKCGKHEHWDSCYYKCDGNQTCDDNDKKWNCPKKDKCLKGCRCDKGYCRDKKGNCVPKQEHPKKCGKHEHWDSCYYKCDGNQTCDENDKKWNCPKKDKCLKGCRCDKGYCRDKKGNCVPKQEHPKPCGKHEHWDSCYYKCDGNQTCDDNDKKWNCPAKDKCLKGCRCDKGYCRDKKGNCVPKQEHPKKCGKHEHWDSCYYKCDGNQTCDDNDKKWNCPKKDKCLKGCRCDKGYCRDKKGNCVPKQEHPKKCGKHEHWDSCYYKCDGNQTCDDNDKKWNCPKKDKCLKGCRCDKGYCRDKKGNCVPKQEHPKKCGKHEHWDSCYYKCDGNQTCDDNDKKWNCPKKDKCLKGCRCDKGYCRDKKGNCVPKQEHPKKCGKHEHWDSCYYKCDGNQTCDDNDKKWNCPKKDKCLKGCRCDKGYCRDKKGNCVPKQEHPKKCGKHEHWDSCYYKCDGNQTCDENDKKWNCPKKDKCLKGCRCDKGYCRDKKGNCVPKQEHPKKCGKHEHWDSCYYKCDGNQTCDDNDKKWNCPKKDKCLKGCRCDKGYCRDKKGNCVPKQEHPKKCGKHEHWDSCYYKCDGNQTCDDNDKKWNCPKKDKCLKGCRCDKGYCRDKKGNCVPKQEHPKKCGKHEHWDSCYYKCDGNQTCDDNDKKWNCPKKDKCLKGCRCDKGYCRDKKGNCVPKQEHPKKCGKHEHWDSCYYKCDGNQTCDDNDKKWNCPKKDKCLKGCRCDKGYCRDKKGNCVPKQEHPKKCGKHEHWDSCYYKCDGNQTCDDNDKKWNCPKKDKCLKGCRCDKGYCRDKKGNCVPKQEHPKKCGKHEHWDACYYKCDGNQTCDDNDKKWNCPKKDKCLKGCRCDKGYCRDKKGNCVPKQEHPKKCGKHEHWDSCYYKCDGNQTCDDNDKKWNCPKKDKCLKGCRCDKGYCRDKKGNCVPKQEHPKKCGKHEHWDSCYYKCDGNQTCDDNDKKWNCPKKDKCLKGCRCDKGYCRDKKGNCVPKQEHPKKCGKHEHWDSCYYKCDGNQTCDDNDKKWNCPAKDKCLKGCRCDKGYCRDKKGNCVPKQEHPKKCGKHEHWDSCYYKCDGNQTCDDNDKKWNCPAKDKCLKGCRCDKGYCRDKKGNCVPKQEHPKKCGKHEHWDSCYYKCDGNQTCDDNDKKWNCPKKDKCLKGCRCDKGYCRDKKGNCVPKQEHPKKCGKHEHWDSCYYKCDGNQTCDDNDKKWNCPKKDKCLKGCRCDKGYCRDKKGNCVPKQEHPKKCGKHEHWDSCYYKCDGNQTCDDNDKKWNCPAKDKCLKGCRCDKGYCRDKKGNCVPKQEHRKYRFWFLEKTHVAQQGCTVTIRYTGAAEVLKNI
ncbi:zonadhesin-like [Cydia splendana]|uniref:zonadhesin-like n=1 Tax=Cydia splendana TaxID=1100963 RepID=UPI00300D51E3